MTVERAQIKSSLFLMDAISYIAQSMIDLRADTECITQSDANCNSVWAGASPASNIPSFLNPLLAELPSIITDAGLSASPTTEEVSLKILKDPKSNRDLIAAIEKINNSAHAATLDQKQIARAKAALYLMDAISYIANSMTQLRSEADCALSGAKCNAIWMGASPLSNIPPRLASNAATLRTVFNLAAGVTSGEDLQAAINSSHLKQPNSNVDLIAALCVLDTDEPFCPAITTISAIGAPDNQVAQGTDNVEITVTGANLPEIADPLTQISLYASGSFIPAASATRQPDGSSITFKANIDPSATLGAHTVKVTSEDSLLSAVSPAGQEIEIVSGTINFTIKPKDIYPKEKDIVLTIIPDPLIFDFNTKVNEIVVLKSNGAPFTDAEGNPITFTINANGAVSEAFDAPDDAKPMALTITLRRN